MTHELTLTIPREWWLTSNQRPHWRAKAVAVANLRVLATAGAQKARLPKGLERVRITAHITYPTASRPDPNNAHDTTKPLVDGLVDYGLVADDDHRHVLGPDHRHGGVTKGKHTVRLVITEVSDDDAA